MPLDRLFDLLECVGARVPVLIVKTAQRIGVEARQASQSRGLQPFGLGVGTDAIEGCGNGHSL